MISSEAGLSPTSLLPEVLAACDTTILGTSKNPNIKRFETIYQVPVKTFDPELVRGNAEPRNDDPRVPAAHKNTEVVETYGAADGESFAVLTADVMFEFRGRRYHKPTGENGQLTEAELQATIAETQDWYCTDAFIAHWIIAFAVQTSTGVHRLGVLRVAGQFEHALDRAYVTDHFNAKSNARVPLVEAGRLVHSEFYLTNEPFESTAEQKESEINFNDGSWAHIPQELAEQLIFERVLPPQLLADLIESQVFQLWEEIWEQVAFQVMALSQEE